MLWVSHDNLSFLKGRIFLTYAVVFSPVRSIRRPFLFWVLAINESLEPNLGIRRVDPFSKSTFMQFSLKFPLQPDNNRVNYKGNRGTCNSTHYIRADALEGETQAQRRQFPSNGEEEHSHSRTDPDDPQ